MQHGRHPGPKHIKQTLLQIPLKSGRCHPTLAQVVAPYARPHKRYIISRKPTRENTVPKSSKHFDAFPQLRHFLFWGCCFCVVLKTPKIRLSKIDTWPKSCLQTQDLETFVCINSPTLQAPARSQQASLSSAAPHAATLPAAQPGSLHSRCRSVFATPDPHTRMQQKARQQRYC